MWPIENLTANQTELLQDDSSKHHQVMDNFIQGLHDSLPKSYLHG